MPTNESTPNAATAALVLVVEDEPPMKRYLATLLETSDYRVIEGVNAKQAISLAASHDPDLILLDLGLPDEDGLAVIERLREWTTTPIIVISAREQETDKVDALDRGAQDYLTKPFGSNELLARMRVALRDHPSAPAEPTFTNGPLRIDYDRRLVYLHDEEVPLTPTEYKLLVYLAKNVGKVLTHRQILREVWGPNYVEHDHYVRVYMSQLRQKFEQDPARPKLLTTETGVGYRMRLSRDAEPR